VHGINNSLPTDLHIEDQSRHFFINVDKNPYMRCYRLRYALKPGTDYSHSGHEASKNARVIIRPRRNQWLCVCVFGQNTI